jgi:hypothetical protein
MRRHRMTGPDRADFTGGVIANGDDEIHHRRIGRCELVPAFAA